MAVINVCDICGEPISEYAYAEEYKIKKNSNWWFQHNAKWVKVSCHNSCIKLLLTARDNQLELDKILEDMRCKVVDNLGEQKDESSN